MNLLLVPVALGAAVLALATCHHAPPPTPAAAAPPIQHRLDTHQQQARDRAAARVARSQAVTEEATDAVQHAPSASDPLAPDLRDAVLAGVQRVREQGDAGRATSDHPGAADEAVSAR